MSIQRYITMFMTAAVAYIMVALSGHDSTRLVWDWLALASCLTALGLAQADLQDASWTRQVLTVIGAFLVGYGQVEASNGYRYGFDLDYLAIVQGFNTVLGAHSNNPNITGPIANAAAKVGVDGVRPGHVRVMLLAVWVLISCVTLYALVF